MKNEDREHRRRTIWKFPLALEPDMQEIQMPMDAEIAYFDFQYRVPYIWAIVDPDVMNIPRRFKIFGTDHPLPSIDKCCYVGTKQDGPLVWHLFELL